MRSSLTLLLAIALALLAGACGDLSSGTRQPGDQRPAIDPAVDGRVPPHDPNAMWPVEELPTSVLVDARGGAARFLRDYLWVRPFDRAGLDAFLSAHPELSVSAPLPFETPEGRVSFPIPDLVLQASGAIDVEPNDILMRIDWAAVDHDRFEGVDLTPFFSSRLTGSSREALTLVRLVVWAAVHDSDKIATVQPVAVAVVPDPAARKPVVSNAGAPPNWCGCLDDATDPATYVATRVDATTDPVVDCSKQAILTGRNLLTLTGAHIRDFHENNEEANFRLWMIPEEDLPLRLPGASPLPLIELPLWGGAGVFFTESGQFEKSVPPHAHESALRGPFRTDGNDFCEWSKREGYPRTLAYAHDGQWQWNTDMSDENVMAFVYESDECWHWTIFYVCNPDDAVDFLPVNRGETLDGPHAYREGGGVTLTFQTIAECRNDATETCDGLDNDCDGIIDESDPDLGAACPSDHRTCVAGPGGLVEGKGTLVCDTGQLRCMGYVDPQRDVCNGEDDDCDGDVDEDDPRANAPCGTNLGTCSTGAAACAAGVLVCVGGTQPQAELCATELDEDCDGGTDEIGCVCADGQTRSCGVRQGRCAPGRQTCAGGEWSECVGAIGPAPETCDGVDNSCDGSIDEGCACPAGATRDCGSSGVGTCVLGTQRCLATGRWSTCSGNVEPVVDVCNGLDDDCDGNADNVGYGLCACVAGATRACGTDTGLCTAGVQTCIAGSWSECSGVAPTSEGAPSDCDGFDNNCNGDVDEGLVNLCGACGPEQVETCNHVDDDCDGLRDEDDAQREFGLQNACGGCGPAPVEVCNDVDDDCDGAVDNGLADCGVQIVEERFELHGNVSREVTLVKPATTQVIPIVMVDEYITQNDDDFAWRATHNDLGNSITFTITTSAGNGGSAVVGRVALIGLGANGASDTLAWSAVNGETRSLGTLSVPPGAGDAIPLVALWTLDNGDDDDFGYQVSVVDDPDTATCAIRTFQGNGDSHVDGYAHLIRLPATTARLEANRSVFNGEQFVLTWPDTAAIPNPVALTSIRGYLPANDDDASWAVRCRRDGTDYVCVATVSGGNSSSHVDLHLALVGAQP